MAKHKEDPLGDLLRSDGTPRLPIPGKPPSAKSVRRTIVVANGMDARIAREMLRESRSYSAVVARALRAYFGVRPEVVVKD